MLALLSRVLSRKQVLKPVGRWQLDTSNWVQRVDMANLDNGFTFQSMSSTFQVSRDQSMKKKVVQTALKTLK